MSTSVDLLSFIPTGTDTKRGLGDWSSDEFYNVLNFGADPTGATDSWAAIQACFDAAYGTYASPHGLSAALNRAVFFPAGDYKVSKMLILRSVLGGNIYGAGSKCTKLTYTGPVPATSGIPPWYGAYGTHGNPTALIATNGWGYGLFSGLTLVMGTVTSQTDPLSATLDDTFCLSLDWNNTGAQGNTYFLMRDMVFKDATMGCVMGVGQFSTDTGTFINCFADNCTQGFATSNSNALNHTLVGCGATNCTYAGVFNRAGSFASLMGGTFSGNTKTFESNFDCVAFLGVFTGDINAFNPQAQPAAYIACTQTAGSAGYFAAGSGSVGFPVNLVQVIDCCKSANGTLNGRAQFYVRGGLGFSTDFPLGNDTSFGGGVREWTTGNVYTVSQLPTTAMEGLKLNVSDSSVTTWGSNVAAGGANHVLVYWNGANWKVIGK